MFQLVLQHIDERILLFINSWGSIWMDNFMYLITNRFIWIPLYVFIAYVLYKNFGLKMFLFIASILILTIIGTDQLCGSVIRPALKCLRPSNPANPISASIHLIHGYRGGKYGMPSCHAANTFALAFFVMLLFRKKWLTFFCFAWAILVSYSRVYAGVHYPSDIVVGMIIGIGMACLLYYLSYYILTTELVQQAHLFVGRDKELYFKKNGYKYISIIIFVGIFVLITIMMCSFIIK